MRGRDREGRTDGGHGGPRGVCWGGAVLCVGGGVHGRRCGGCERIQFWGVGCGGGGERGAAGEGECGVFAAFCGGDEVVQ